LEEVVAGEGQMNVGEEAAEVEAEVGEVVAAVAVLPRNIFFPLSFLRKPPGPGP
jgi:hypothetical protein